MTVLALQPVKDLLIGTRPKIHAAIITADADTFTVVVANSGNGPAALESIRINANKKGSGTWDTVFNSQALPDRAIKPGDLKIVAFSHHHEIPLIAVPGEIGPKAECNLTVGYYELDGFHVETGELFKCSVDKSQ